MNLLTRARKFIQEKEDYSEQGLEVLRKEAMRLGVLSSPNDKLSEIEWPLGLKAALLLFLQYGRSPDPDSLDAVAALLLYMAEASEKGEKGEKSEIRYGLTVEEARTLSVLICRGQRVRLTDDGQIEMVDA